MSGGARMRSGRVPNPAALRREVDKGDWIRLPLHPDIPTPTWPLTPAATSREKTLWTGEWRRPQATMWLAQSQEIEVAIYVRTLSQAEKRGVSSSQLIVLRQQMDALGLTVSGLLRNRWSIAGEHRTLADEEADEAAADAPTQRKAPAGGRARDRLQLVVNGG